MLPSTLEVSASLPLTFFSIEFNIFEIRSEYEKWNNEAIELNILEQW